VLKLHLLLASGGSLALGNTNRKPIDIIYQYFGNYRKHNVVAFATQVIIFLLGFVLVLVGLIFAFKMGEHGTVLQAVVPAVGTSLIATAIATALSDFFQSERKDEITKDLQQACKDEKELFKREKKDFIKRSGELGDLLTRAMRLDAEQSLGRGFRGVEWSKYRNYEEMIRNAKKLDYMCHNGGSIIRQNIGPLNDAIKSNKVMVRVLINNNKYPMFNSSHENHKEYKEMLQAYCPDQEGHEGEAANTIADLKRINKTIKEGEKKIKAYSAECFIAGQVLIIDNRYVFYTPYIPYVLIAESIRFQFEHYLEEDCVEKDFAQKFITSFESAWDSAAKDTRNKLL
jgi:hypothetical protein